MAPCVLSLGKFDRELLQCTIPRFQHGSGKRYQLHILHDGKPIYLQTPKVFLTKKFNSLAITLPARSWSPGVRLFYDVIQAIDSYILKHVGCKGQIYKILKQYFEIKNNRFARRFRESIYSVNHSINYLFGSLATHAQIFDENREFISDIATERTARLILKLQHLWIRVDDDKLLSFGCHWSIEQAALLREFPPLVRECLFFDDNSCDKAVQTDPVELAPPKPKPHIHRRPNPFAAGALLAARGKLGRPKISLGALLAAKGKIKPGKTDGKKKKKSSSGFGISLDDLQGITLRSTSRPQRKAPPPKPAFAFPRREDLKRNRVLKIKVPALPFTESELLDVKLKETPKLEKRARRRSFIEEALHNKFKLAYG
jgi:hypothetical protein